MKQKVIVFSIIAIITGCVVGIYFFSHKESDKGLSENEILELPIYETHGTYEYNPYKLEESVGINNYVFVGEVIDYQSTEYQDYGTLEDENGNEYKVGTPYSNYTVRVIENIKGELVTDKDIMVKKFGGVTEDKESVILCEDDELPVSGNIYVFLTFVQPDGSLLIAGPKSNVRLDGIDNMEDIRSDETVQKYVRAFDNQVLPNYTVNDISIYDVDYK